MNEYQKFLQQKQKAKEHKGFTPLPMNPKLFPFQQHIVAQNIMKGKHAVFADCGLGKTVMELETASQIVRHTNKPVLVMRKTRNIFVPYNSKLSGVVCIYGVMRAKQY